jgi:hypothetical protein
MRFPRTKRASRIVLRACRASTKPPALEKSSSRHTGAAAELRDDTALRDRLLALSAMQEIPSALKPR